MRIQERRFCPPLRMYPAAGRLLCGAILLTAAMLKLNSLAVASHGHIAPLLEVIVVQCEFALGVWLLTGFASELAVRIAIAVFVAFSGVALSYAFEKRDTCGCFGDLRVSPWHTLAVDIVCVAMLLCSLGGFQQWFGLRVAAMLRQASFACFMLLVCAFIVNTQIGNGRPGSIAILEPERWIGQPLPIMDEVEAHSSLSQGNKLLVLVDGNCSVCAEAIPRYKQFAARLHASRPSYEVVIVDISLAEGKETDIETSSYRRASDSVKWFVKTPCEIELENGRVVSIGYDAIDNDQLWPPILSMVGTP